MVCDPSVPTAFLAEVARSRVKVALHDAFIEHSAHENVRVREKPSRGVVCKEARRKGEIKFVALTDQVKLMQSGTKAAVDSLCLGPAFEDPEKGSMDAYISFNPLFACTGTQSHTFVVPYWLVQPTPDEEEANMEHYTVKINCGTHT